MFHIRPRRFTRAVIVGGLLSLAMPAADSVAAPQAAQAQPSQATPDADLVAKIRQAIADDKAIAQYAQTLKIVSSSGLVTLKGPVKTEADKKAIGAKADQIAGEKNVMNNLFVSADAAKPAPETP
jgi:hyperosmotically inducible periplasmic protein